MKPGHCHKAIFGTAVCIHTRCISLHVISPATLQSSSARDAVAAVPMVVRAEMALDATIACCVGNQKLSEGDWSTVETIIGSVFGVSNDEDFKAVLSERKAQ